MNKLQHIAALQFEIEYLEESLSDQAMGQDSRDSLNALIQDKMSIIDCLVEACS